MKMTEKVLASLAIVGMALTMVPINILATGTMPTRLAGNTATQTAVQIAEQTGWRDIAILASSTPYGMVDALTAGPLAYSLKAPILLTGAGSALDPYTKAELTKLNAKKVYVTSGTAVIKQSVIDELKGMGISVVQLGGYERAETSVNIAKQMTGVTKVVVANGIPDALSVASIAAAANKPILLTNKDSVPASVSVYLASNTITSSDVIGGTGVISDAVKARFPNATRHFGLTAYDTNNQVIQDFDASIKYDNIFVANGITGIDALAGAPLVAQTESAIVLTDGKTVPPVANFLGSKASDNQVITALGGSAVVSEAVRVNLIFLPPVPNPIKTYEDSNYTYILSSGTAQIVGYSGVGGDITIPSTLGGIPVSKIFSGTFNDITKLSGITSVTIPQGVTSIQQGAFSGCSSLTKIIVDNSNLNFSSIDGVLYNKEGTTFVACPNGLTNINIPESVTDIDSSAFSGCTDLTSISIPNCVTKIGLEAFSNCTGLTSISIPQGVTSIGPRAFSNCTGLTSIIIPNRITSIGEYTFLNCTHLNSISIPVGVTNIGYGAFFECKSLTSITIPQEVSTIDLYAFSGCTGLSSIKFLSATTIVRDNFPDTIPATTKIIGYDPSTAKDYSTKYNRTFEVIDTSTLQ